MYVCMYVCMYIYIYICECVCGVVWCGVVWCGVVCVCVGVCGCVCVCHKAVAQWFLRSEVVKVVLSLASKLVIIPRTLEVTQVPALRCIFR